MTTLGDLTDECLSYLYGFGESKDKVATLTSTMTSGSLTFTVDDARQIDRGMVEIESEIIQVTSVDVTTGTVTVAPWGRGLRGTTAAAHSANLPVWNSPRFPRSRVKQEINQVIDFLFPNLFAVAVDETNTARPTTVTYPLPADAESVVSISYQTLGPSKQWYPVTRYKVDYNADATAFPTGKTVDIYADMAPGKTMKIVYRRQFLQFDVTDETQTFASRLLDEGYRDIIRLLVVGRMLTALDAVRMELDTIESVNRAQYTQPTQALAVARGYMAIANDRINQERRRLLTQYPTTQVRMS